MSIKTIFTVIALAALAAGPAQAADIYLGAAGGTTKLHVADDPGIQVDRNDTGYKVFLGVAVGPSVAVEGGYTDLGKANYAGTFNSTAVSGDVKATGVFVDLIGRVPVASSFGVYGKLGVLRGKAKGSVTGLGAVSESSTSARWALGADYAFTKSTAVRLEWERNRFKAFGDSFDVDMVSLGVAVGF